MLRLAPFLTITLLIAPILFGLAATIGPAFGYFPTLGGNEINLKAFLALWNQPGIVQSSLISLFIAILAAGISLLIVMIFVATWSSSRSFSVVYQLLSPILSIPHAAAAFGLAFLIAPSGWIMRIISPEITGMTRPPDWLILNDPFALSMIAALVIKEIPFLFLVTMSAMAQSKPRRMVYLSRSLGHGEAAGFLFSVWPQIYAQIRLPVFAVIAYSSSVVDVALILGPTNPAPLAVRLISWMNDPELTMRFLASAGAVLQLGITIVALMVWVALERGASTLMDFLRDMNRSRFLPTLPLRWLSALIMGTSIIAVFAGLLVLSIWSVAGYWRFPDAFPQTVTLKSWHAQLPLMRDPLFTTMIVAGASAFFALLLVLACLERENAAGFATNGKRSNRALLILYLPLLVPQVSFVFGLQIFFLSTGLANSLAAVVFVHIIFVLPYVFLSLADPWRAFDNRFAHIANALGKGPNTVFWQIRLPILLRSVVIALALGIAVSISQYLPTLLIGGGRWPTITTEAVALASGGDRRLIGVFAFMQLLLPFLAFFIAALIPAALFYNRRDMRAGI